MNKALLVILIFVASLQFTFAQEVPYEYMGAIKLNDSSFISYKLIFNEKDGAISGYSISDVGGAYETKSTIKGNYDADSKDFKFKEIDIVYTKSSLDNFDMCLVHFATTVRKLASNNTINGSFKGKYIDEKPCLNGELFLTNMEEAVKRAQKIDKKLQKSKMVSKEIKEKFNALAMVDTLSQSSIKKSENLNVFASGNEVIFSVYDSGKVDGDMINLYVNDRLVLENFSTTAEKQKIILKREDKPVVVKIVALNEGSSPGNTLRIEALGGKEMTTTRTLLSANEEAYLTFYFR